MTETMRQEEASVGAAAKLAEAAQQWVAPQVSTQAWPMKAALAALRVAQALEAKPLVAQVLARAAQALEVAVQQVARQAALV